MRIRTRTALVVLIAVAAACGTQTATTTTSTVEESENTTTPSATTTALDSTTTTEVGPVVLAELLGDQTLSARVSLDASLRYRLDPEGLPMEISPPSDGWELFHYQRSGAEAGALFGWRGPSGFQRETLDVLIESVASDGVDAAWLRVEAIGEAGGDTVGEQWSLVDQGTGLVGGVRADWREYRTPPRRTEDVDRPEFFQYAYSLKGAGVARLLMDTSVRFYVVPLGDLTVTLAAYETRCACLPNPTGGYDRGNQVGDEVENELSDWIEELEDFLSAIEFPES